ncbi:siderophore ABC transporter substrate-binding protein [Chelativorans sp. AA-79]|uniref:siderophore ABC transporter substrate-binding protein n=1 Tax=Chelativorans sp. AA-79 TaxID=3028735 RepID=UPI0023F6FA70|nr:siderophore ABC transporter substrate-binding protein [Chelativorans sp. AA-79]WEX11846.1 siderophore ABC transporter substrate-binding protein [Chelativorans sp. AA-79]
MIRRRTAVAGLLLASLAFGLPQTDANAQEITVRHAQGETSVPANPGTVLVLDLAALDTLDAIGVEVGGVPQGPKPERLSKYNSDDYPKIGSLFEPDYEAVNAAEPDLIIAGGRSSAKYADLARIAPTIDLSVDPEHYLDSAKANAEILGRIFGKEDAVAEHLRKLDASIAVLREKARGIGKGLIILTTGGRMSAYGPGSRFGVLHDDFGIQPAVPDLDVATHGQSVSYEFILETNPDWLFVIDRDAAIGREGEAARQMLDNDLVNQTTAWREGHVVYLDPSDWYLAGSGLRALEATVQQLNDAIGG